MSGPRLYLLDNYDSFTWNLAQIFMELGACVTVRRHDDVSVDEVMAWRPDGIVISPGPGRPEKAGISQDLVREAAGRVPVLGVCLGHQAIGQVYGGRIVRAPRLMHGKTSPVRHDGRGVFAGLSNPFEATRYHSLVVETESLPADLVACATTDDEGVSTLMGLRHRDWPEVRLEGVQFHPESILTLEGRRLLSNFVGTVA
ncbi:MAG: anthranilate synthase component II [Candidatus Polarisedimenticolia bacterium]